MKKKSFEEWLAEFQDLQIVGKLVCCRLSFWRWSLNEDPRQPSISDCNTPPILVTSVSPSSPRDFSGWITIHALMNGQSVMSRCTIEEWLLYFEVME